MQDAIVRRGTSVALIGRIRANELALGADLKTAKAADDAIKALQGTDAAAAAQATADLIGKAADGSNLTLDPDLDSFYAQDILTVRVPAAVAGVAGLAATVAGTGGNGTSGGHGTSEADRVSVGVQVGALQSTLDGMTADITSAVDGIRIRRSLKLSVP